MQGKRGKGWNRRLLAIVVGLAAFVLVFAAADGFNVLSTAVGGGSQTVASCVPTGGQAKTDWILNDIGPLVTGVKVTITDSGGNTSSACDGLVAHVALYAGSTAILNANGHATVSGGSATVTLVAAALPSDITQIKVAIGTT